MKLIQSVKNKKINDEILEEIKRHGEWLYLDENYVKKHNHGIFEDGSLIKVGYFLNNDKYINKGIDRLDEQLKFAFPNKHIHIENSIGYHVGIISYLKGISMFLNNNSNIYSETASSYYQGAIDYLVHVYKPNLAIPFIGDTLGKKTQNISSISEDYGNENLKYIKSRGLIGTKPEYKTKQFMNDGTIIFREHWDTANFDQATWLLFKSGYLSSTHKHADDLSFLLLKRP